MRGFVDDLRPFAKRRVVALCLTVLLIFVTSGVTLPLTPLYLKSLGADPVIIGLMFSVFGLGEGIFGFVWGTLADRIGITIPLLIQTFGAAVGLALFGLVPIVGALFAIRFLLAGMGSAVFPTGRGYLAHTVPPNRKGVAMAVFAVLTSGGMSLGALLGGLVVDVVGFRGVFLLSGVVSTAAGLVILTQFRNARITGDGPPTGVLVAATESATAPTAASVAAVDLARESILPLLVLSSIAALAAAASTSAQAFLPLLMTDYAGLSAGQVSLAYGVSLLLSLMFVLPGGGLSDRIGAKRVMLGALALMIPGLLGLAVARTYPLIVLSMMVNSIGFGLMAPPVLALMSHVSSARRQGRSLGLYVVAIDVGIVVGPAVGGWIWSTSGPRVLYPVAAVAVGLAVLLAGVFVEETRWMARPRLAMGEG